MINKEKIKNMIVLGLVFAGIIFTMLVLGEVVNNP